MAISAKDVAELREKTGVGMMECKKALTEADGNMGEAIKILRERGLAVAAKKASRIAAEGVVDILYCEESKTAAMIEVNAETDFVAKNDNFRAFVRQCLEVILKEKPVGVDELLEKPCADGSMTVDGLLKEKILQIGENLSIRRFVTVQGILSTYIHNRGTIGVIVKVSADGVVVDGAGFAEFKKNLALQIASMGPVYVAKRDVPPSVIDEEREIITNLVKNDPDNAKKPPQVIEKMIEGKLSRYYKDNCLLEQDYVKEEKMTVSGYIKEYANKIGASVMVDEFHRFEKGEGLQKREDDFADEIAKLTGGAR